MRLEPEATKEEIDALPKCDRHIRGERRDHWLGSKNWDQEQSGLARIEEDLILSRRETAHLQWQLDELQQ